MTSVYLFVSRSGQLFEFGTQSKIVQFLAPPTSGQILDAPEEIGEKGSVSSHRTKGTRLVMAVDY